MMRVLLDTNVLLDVLLDRAPWSVEASAIWAACEQGQMMGEIPASAITDIFYIARRASDIATARVAVGLCLATFAVCPVDRQAIERAVLLPGGDFEDNLQIACAMAANLDAIVTRNPSDFAGSPLPVLTPAELLRHLGVSPAP
jgi:predicted nucleic acid-binding protein